MHPVSRQTPTRRGTAVYVPAGAKLVFQMHYTPNGSPQEDRSMIGIRFADPTTVKKMVRGRPVSEVSFRFRPETRTTKSDEASVHERHAAFSLFPHIARRGKDFKFDVDYPNENSEVLLNVPKYDFNWQIRYRFAAPLFIPQGDDLPLHGSLRQLGR